MRPVPFLAGLIGLFAILGGPAVAQELTASGGTMSVDAGDRSYAWAFDYRQVLHKHFALSIGWLNEGHPTDHHRDGPVAQLWFRQTFGDRFGLGIGYGYYRWFDTARVGSGFENQHGGGSILSAAATWDASKRVFVRITVNRVHANDSFDSSSYLLGLGVRLWVPFDGTPPQETAPPPQFTRATADEFILFAGRSIENNFADQKTSARGVEFRHGLATYVDWTASFFNEGHGSLRRNSLASQLWLVRAFSARRVEVGLGAGVFYRLDRRASETVTERLHDYDGLVTATFGWRFGEHALVRLNWNRIATTNSRDKDVIVLGAGFQWGAPEPS